jgi:hypothetical protein
MTHIYGLEKVRIPKINHEWFASSPDRLEKWSYKELLALIKASLLDEDDAGDLNDPLAILNPPGPHVNYRIHTLREYVSNNPDDELLEHELNGNECWNWQTTDYWSEPSRRDWRSKVRVGGSHARSYGRAETGRSGRRYGK